MYEGILIFCTEFLFCLKFEEETIKLAYVKKILLFNCFKGESIPCKNVTTAGQDFLRNHVCIFFFFEKMIKGWQCLVLNLYQRDIVLDEIQGQ